jgi:hypothetical protein
MTEMLDFLKAMSSADRLRIIGLLTQTRTSRSDIAAQLDLPLRVIADHLAFLEQVGVVSHTDQVYALDSDRLATLARDQLAQARPAYTPAPGLDRTSQKVLKTYLNPDGSIKQLPLQAAKLRVILNYLIQAFAQDVDYTEREVNAILRRFNEDTAGLRRDLVDAGLLDRESDGSRYWRPAESVEGSAV